MNSRYLMNRDSNIERASVKPGERIATDSDNEMSYEIAKDVNHSLFQSMVLEKVASRDSVNNNNNILADLPSPEIKRVDTTVLDGNKVVPLTVSNKKPSIGLA